MYSRVFTRAVKGKLSIDGLRDYATVYINDAKVAELNRQQNNFSCEVDIPANGRLAVLVENMGRINYGSEIVNNLKGIISPVKINEQVITGNWQMRKFPMNVPPAYTRGIRPVTGHPTVYRGMFNITKTGDTFLDTKNLGKGIIFVNGHNLGRYWKIGPQQTLYLPGCWLQKGRNIITVFEQQNDVIPLQINTLTQPVLTDLKVK